jgi:hypothetical protein
VLRMYVVSRTRYNLALRLCLASCASELCRLDEGPLGDLQDSSPLLFRRRHDRLRWLHVTTCEGAAGGQRPNIGPSQLAVKETKPTCNIAIL